MNIKEKLDALQNVQDYEVEVKDKLEEIIKDTYDDHCHSVEDIVINDTAIEVTYMYYCRGESDTDYVTIPREWLDDGFDYKTAYEEVLRNAEELRKKAELEEKYEVVESLNSTDEYCVFLKHDSSRVMESLYSAIRNALAHGSFLMKKRRGTNMYFFANYDGYLKAVIQLKEETLLNWISLFQSNPEDVKRSID